MANAARILVIEADETLSRKLIAELEAEGFRPQAAKNRAQASALLRSLRFDAILSEVRLPDGDGEQIYRDALPFLGSTPIIFITEPGNIDQAVRLVKAGAADCLQKPFDIAALVARLRPIIGERATLKEKHLWPEPAMMSASMLDLRGRVERLAATSVSALIIGETGSGKEVAARYMHRRSARAGEPFVVIRCGSLAGQDGDRVLFGEKTRVAGGGDQLQSGALEHAGRGTLFLDEIGELPASIEGKLVQVIDSKVFTRVGDLSTEVPFEARILAASHLSAAALRERVAPDLLSRIAVIEITVPPLRGRQADIEPLVAALLPDVASELGVPSLSLDAAAITAMRAYAWPGNVRELRNRLVRALSFAKGSTLGIEDFFPSPPDRRGAGIVQSHIG
jgi:DNA-binding NtrC family response regulator